MPLRTPRRRISPRTRKRYRAIKGFFKRAIGGSSQPDLVINSSTVNVTDLKHKIVGLEQRLSEVSRTCRELIYLDGSRRESQTLIPLELKDLPQLRRDDSAGREPQATETKILYQTSENHYRNSEESDCIIKHNRRIDDGFQNDKMIDDDEKIAKGTKKKRKEESRVKNSDMKPNLRKLKTQSAFDCVGSAYASSSFHSLNELKEGHHSYPGYSGDRTDRRLHKMEQNIHRHQREEIHKEQIKRVVPRNYDDHRVDRTRKHSKNRKCKREGNELDQDFIADIIKRQYKPVQMFGRKESDIISQISEPLCRDREFTIYDDIQEDTKLCNCCCGGRHSPELHRHSDNSDVRSVCDARLYSFKRNPRINKYGRAHADAYNDSELYDLIPVKEKTSPKSRRKFARDNLGHYHDYREVPPSPRTHRPRLNLKAQYYTESEDHTERYHNKKVSPKRNNKYEEPIETFKNDYSLQMHSAKKNKHRHKLPCKPEQVHQEMGTTSTIQYPQHCDVEQNNRTIDTSLNNTQDLGSTSDKTDRALFEIKDILQSFLQEIKKETSSSDKSDVSAKVTENCANNPRPHVNAGVIPNSGHSFNYSTPHCSSAPAPYIIPPYPNACCYPVMPMYSMNCMQNGFVMPSQSFTCGCSKTEESTNKNKANNTTGNETLTTETDELIKEIYKFVAESPTFPRKQDTNVITDNPNNRGRDSFENKLYTTRSAGGSTKVSKHDATVGTQAIKCNSKSCEAIGSRMIAERYYSETNPTTYSDSAAENISLEATATTSFVTEISTERSEKHKTSKPSTKFRKVLQSFGLFKKKKKDAIEEESESESTIDVVINKSRPRFQQEITNYMMSDQVYDRPPPVPKDYRQPSHYPHDYRPPYNPAMQNYAPPPNDPYYGPRMQQKEKQKGGHYHPGYPSAPPYSNYENFHQPQPQVPFCLKEIEVKSMATQSERKMSFFRKIKQKMQPPEQKRDDGPRNFATQTKQEKSGLWKSLQTKGGKNEQLAFSFQQQQKLNSADHKIRNAMLKKMFYKRNPFSPRNLIVRTLMGKDKSSYGEPPAMYRPSMFI